MNHTALVSLRILAIASALSVITCQVVNRQQQANDNAAAGDKGVPGPEAPPPRPSFAPSSKSLTMAVGADDLKSGGTELLPAASVSPPTPPPKDFIAGTKSAKILRPSDVSGILNPKDAPLSSNAEEAARLLARGVAFYDRGNYKDAEASFAAALALEPANGGAKTSLVRCRQAMAAKAAVPAPAALPQATPAPASVPATAPVLPVPAVRPYAPSSKSARMVSPEDLRRIQQLQAPNTATQQQAPRQQ